MAVAFDVRRAALGAPNEAKFGFAQATATPRVVHVAGQVGKDNATGAMIPSTDFADHVRRCLANAHEACAAATGTPGTIVAAAAHVPSALDDDRLRVVAGALGPDAALVVVGVASLASADYLVEISATAVAGQEEHVLVVPHLSGRAGAVGAAAVAAGELVHLGGHLAWGADGTVRGATDAEQLSGALLAVTETLERAGSSLGRLLSTHVYVRRTADPADFDAICQAHREAVGIAPPAATLVFVEHLPADARVMVAGVAAAGGS